MQPEIEIQKLSKRIIQLEGQVAFLYKHLGVEFVPEAAPNDDPRIVEIVKKGKQAEGRSNSTARFIAPARRTPLPR